MADYPSHEILLGSSVEEESGVEDDFAQSGSQHSRVFHSQSYYRFNLLHTLTLAEWATFHAFYLTNKRADLGFTYYATSPAVAYTVKFISPPQQVENIGLGWVVVQAQVRGYVA